MSPSCLEYDTYFDFVSMPYTMMGAREWTFLIQDGRHANFLITRSFFIWWSFFSFINLPMIDENDELSWADMSVQEPSLYSSATKYHGIEYKPLFQTKVQL